VAPVNTFAITVIDNTNPIITHTPVTSINQGEDLTLTTTVTDDCAIGSVQLFYRTPGNSWQSKVMGRIGDTYSAVILDSEITSAGVDYYIQARDSHGNQANSPADAPTSFYHVEVIPEEEDTPRPTGGCGCSVIR